MAAKKPRVSLTREDVIAAIGARKRAVQPIDVPEWGGTVYLRRLSVEDLKATGFLGGTGGDPADVPVQVVRACVTSENGDLMFTPEDLPTLAGADFPVVMRIFAAIAKANGLSNDQLEEAVAAFGVAQDGGNSSE